MRFSILPFTLFTTLPRRAQHVSMDGFTTRNPSAAQETTNFVLSFTADSTADFFGVTRARTFEFSPADAPARARERMAREVERKLSKLERDALEVDGWKDGAKLDRDTRSSARVRVGARGWTIPRASARGMRPRRRTRAYLGGGARRGLRGDIRFGFGGGTLKEICNVVYGSLTNARSRSSIVVLIERLDGNALQELARENSQERPSEVEGVVNVTTFVALIDEFPLKFVEKFEVK